ncbi:MAG TPA: SIP domain-containing protein [Acidimicrobiales bacterium]
MAANTTTSPPAARTSSCAGCLATAASRAPPPGWPTPCGTSPRRPGGPYVWGGAESRAMRDVRRYLRREVGIERERVSLTPYWRHRAHADDPDDAAD